MSKVITGILLFILAVLLFGASAVLTLFTRGITIVLTIAIGIWCVNLAGQVPAIVWLTTAGVVATTTLGVWLRHQQIKARHARITEATIAFYRKRNEEQLAENAMRVAERTKRPEFHSRPPGKSRRKDIRNAIRGR